MTTQNHVRRLGAVARSLCRLAALLLLAGAGMLSCTARTAQALRQVPLNAEPLEPLDAAAACAAVTEPSARDAMCFAFTAGQLSALWNQCQTGAGASLRIVLLQDGAGGAAGEAEFGFLTLDEVLLLRRGAAKKRAPVPEIPGERARVRVDFAHLPAKAVTLSLCLPRAAGPSDLPQGFFVRSSAPVSLVEVSAGAATVGCDLRGRFPLYATGSGGGTVDFSAAAFDFTAAREDMGGAAEIALCLQPLADVGSPGNQRSLRVRYGTEELTVRRSPAVAQVTLQTAAFRTEFAPLAVLTEGSTVQALLMTARTGDAADPLLTDVGLILSWPRDHWRHTDYELFRWEEFPGVLFFDFADHTVQNEFFTRLAFFAEKQGYKGTLVGDDFVRNAHGYNAHDYRAETLAEFFTAAARSGFRLNARELLLRGILLRQKVIVDTGGGTYAGGTGNVISISRQSSADSRALLLAHESWHGIYFGDAEFRAFVSREYDAFDARAMEFLQGYWSSYPSLQYDTADDYLMRNEFMAYLMQQSVADAADYFESKAWWQTVAAAYPEACAYVHRSQAGDFVAASRSLSGYAFGRWGLEAGRTALVTRR